MGETRGENDPGLAREHQEGRGAVITLADDDLALLKDQQPHVVSNDFTKRR